MTPNDDKTVTIIINTRPVEVPKKERLSYEEVVTLAGIPLGPDSAVTVAYSKGEDRKPQGTLVAGQDVKIKEGMVFDVARTNRS